MKISCPELTILDLLRYPRAAAGLDNIATVLIDLGDQIREDKLAQFSVSFERSVLQRLGYMLCILGHEDKVHGLYDCVTQNLPLPWVELEPALAADPDFSPGVIMRDERWHVTVRRIPEPDE